MKTTYKRIYLNEDEVVTSKALSIIDKPDYQIKRLLIQEEINNAKVLIDKECFKKSHMDKVKLKEEKKSYKKVKDTVKYQEDQDNLLIQIVTSKQPIKCGELIIGSIK